jgi:hypothetical protein
MRAFFNKFALEILTALATALTAVAGVYWKLGTGAVVGAGTLIALLYAFASWRRDALPRSGARKRKYVSAFAVDCDDARIVVHLNGVQRESVNWADLSMVAIRIEAEVMLLAPYWLLFGAGGNGCRYPSDAVGNEKLLEAMQQRLPGFDNAAVIKAMGMLSGGIEVWRRDQAGSGAA